MVSVELVRVRTSWPSAMFACGPLNTSPTGVSACRRSCNVHLVRERPPSASAARDRQATVGGLNPAQFVPIDNQAAVRTGRDVRLQGPSSAASECLQHDLPGCARSVPPTDLRENHD
jgi:hypothetical protein